MSIAPYIKEIARQGDSARSLNREQAHDLMAQVLDRGVSDFEIGAFAVAMRLKGETLDELCGFLDAAHERCATVACDAPVVLLPSYNGARRLPNLTALLALRLARAGVQVLLHGPTRDPARVTTAEVFEALGLPIASGVEDAASAWHRREPAFVPIEVLCPPLAPLLDVRRAVGLRNSGHTIAKMLQPCSGARALRVVNHTHPDFGRLMAEFARAEQADMLLMRGTEGEPVADARRVPRMELVLAGEPQPALVPAPQDGSLSELPQWPAAHDAATTAGYIREVLSGDKPMPAPIELQAQTLLRALALMGTPR